MDDIRKEVAKYTPEEVERISGVPGAQLERVAKMFSQDKPSCLIWAMGQTQHTVGTANVRAYCTLLLATGNVGAPGTGANIFRGHTNVQGATDLGLDIVTLPLYYGLAEPAWRHWSRVWEVPYDWFVDRFDKITGPDGKEANTMQTPGIPSTRWFDATLYDKKDVSQKDNIKAMMVFGHGGNTVPRMPEMVKGLSALDLLVIADPHPTNFVSLGNRKDNTYLLPIATSYETAGSRTASNRAIQWGEQIVKPIFESKDDLEVMYLLTKKLGFADTMFKNIKVENNLPVAEMLSEAKDVEVQLVGGQYLARQSVLFGEQARRCLRLWKCDLAFLGAEGMTQAGLWNSQRDVVLYQRTVVELTKRSVFCLDTTKLGQEAPEFLLPWAEVDTMLTDATAEQFKAAGIKLTKGQLINV